jgi:predicted CopG family antitoxin
MATRYRRAQVLLGPEQHRELTEMARRQRRSVSEVIRQLADGAIARQRGDAEDKYRRWLDRRARIDELNEQIARATTAASRRRWTGGR